jgi:hypothetical protein
VEAYDLLLQSAGSLESMLSDHLLIDYLQVLVVTS